MHSARKSRETEKIHELVRHYSDQGFKVERAPSAVDLPDFMRSLNLTPDLIAYGAKENLVIEVRTGESVSGARELGELAERVRQQPGWDFVLVMTNPKAASGSERIGNVMDAAQVHQRLAEATALFEQRGQFLGAALLVAWSGLEAAIRFAMSRLYDREARATLANLVRDAVMLGVLSRSDGQFLEDFVPVRNQIAHGFGNPRVKGATIQRIIRLGEKVLAETDGAIRSQR